ncbi:MAG: YkoP family protein [Methylovirgula sp.]
MRISHVPKKYPAGEAHVRAAVRQITETERLGHSHPWLGALLAPLDRYLRLRQRVREYTSATTCILRIQLLSSAADVSLADGTRLRRGERFIDLHFWNEHVPAIPKRGPTLHWARQMNRCFAESLRELAAYLAARPEFDDVRAIRVNMSLGPPARGDQIARIVARYGFERVAAPQPRTFVERMHRLGENILVSLLVLASNSGALKADTLRRGRMLAYLSRRSLERLHGPGPTRRPH